MLFGAGRLLLQRVKRFDLCRSGFATFPTFIMEGDADLAVIKGRSTIFPESTYNFQNQICRSIAARGG